MEPPTQQTEVAEPTDRGKLRIRPPAWLTWILGSSATLLSLLAIVVSFLTYVEQESANRLADEANKVAKEALDLAGKAEERERLAREQVQVLNVAWYVGKDDKGNESVVIVNRNADAIYGVELTFDEGGQKPTYVSVDKISGCKWYAVPLKVNGFTFPDGPINLHLRDSQGIRWIINSDHIRIKESSRLDPSKFSDATDTIVEYITSANERNCLAFDR